MNIYQIGLLFNIAGTIILAAFGLPNYYAPKHGGVFLTMGADPNIKDSPSLRYNKRRKLIAWTGIILVGLGFICQFLYSFQHP